MKKIAILVILTMGLLMLASCGSKEKELECESALLPKARIVYDDEGIKEYWIGDTKTDFSKLFNTVNLSEDEDVDVIVEKFEEVYENLGYTCE